MSRILRSNYQDWPRRLNSRVESLERRVAIAGTTIAAGTGDVLDANMISNAGFEQGLAGWKVGPFVGTPAVVNVTGAYVFDGALACEVRCDSPDVMQYMRPMVTLAAAPGERWRLSAKIKSTLVNSTAKLVLATSSVDATNENADGSTGVTWVVASSTTVVSGTNGATVTADAIVPAGRSYVGAYFGVVPDPADTSGAAYIWYLDSCSMARVLFDASPVGP